MDDNNAKLKPVVIKFVRYSDDINIFFEQREAKRITSLRKSETLKNDNIKQEKNYGFYNVWTTDGRIPYLAEGCCGKIFVRVSENYRSESLLLNLINFF